MISIKQLIRLLPLLLILLITGCNKTDSDNPEIDTLVSDPQAFNWQLASGETIQVMFNNHPYADAIIAELGDFEDLTGIHVEFSLTEEEYYFDKVTYALSSDTAGMDVFMSGIEQLWHYDELGYIEDLAPYVANDGQTQADYHVEDFFPELMEILRVHGPEGDRLLALPIGFEINTLAYNKRIFEERGLEPPTTYEEMKTLAESLNEHSGVGTYGVAIRGTKNWSMINTAYISYYAMFGGQDFETRPDGLNALVDSPASQLMNDSWRDFVAKGSSADWQDLTWYNCADDLGYGKAAMFLDADIVSLYVNNNHAYPEAGNIGWVPMPLPEGANDRYSNIWTWTLSLNKNSQEKLAAWLFIQYFTHYDHLYKSATVYHNGDMPRQSIWNDPEFRSGLEANEGYIQAFEATIDHADLLFTPHIHFFETATKWAEAIRLLVLNPDLDTQSVLDDLKEDMNQIVNE